LTEATGRFAILGATISIGNLVRSTIWYNPKIRFGNEFLTWIYKDRVVFLKLAAEGLVFSIEIIASSVLVVSVTNGMSGRLVLALNSASTSQTDFNQKRKRSIDKVASCCLGQKPRGIATATSGRVTGETCGGSLLKSING